MLWLKYPPPGQHSSPSVETTFCSTYSVLEPVPVILIYCCPLPSLQSLNIMLVCLVVVMKSVHLHNDSSQSVGGNTDRGHGKTPMETLMSQRDSETKLIIESCDC